MLSRRSSLSLAAFVFTFMLAASPVLAQSGVRPKPSPTPEEAPDEEKIFTEEVRVPVFAFDEQGRFDPRLEVDDVLVNEDGVPQQVKSVRRLPASVLILLGTGGEVSPFMRTNTTRAIAMNVLKSLREGDRIAALGFSGKTEVLHGWTEDKMPVARALKSKLISGPGSDLSRAIVRSVELLREQPVGNRHLVLITDAVDTASSAEYSEAVRRLIAAQTTLHVISYTEVGKREMKKASKPKEAPGMTQSRADIATVGIDPTRPPGARVGGGINPSSVNSGIRLDPELRRRRKAYERDMKRGEGRLKTLAEETGGRILLAGTTEEMVEQGEEVAREIDAQYVVTYQPKRPLRAASATEYRRIHVGARRIGLTLRARRGYVVGTMR